MYIAPDSTIWLLQNVPLDPSYEHTCLWGSAAQQEAWFTSHALRIFDKVSYQRHQNNSIRLEIPAEEAMVCNYMAFENTAFAGHMFYAFITDVAYVNNKTCEIFYELDVMQTFLFDAHLEECWVVREHSATDVPGDNLMAESIDIGPVITSYAEKSGYMSNYNVIMTDVFRDS